MKHCEAVTVAGIWGAPEPWLSSVDRNGELSSVLIAVGEP